MACSRPRLPVEEESDSGMSKVDYIVRDDVAVLTLNSPPVNGLGQGVRAGLLDAIEQAEHSADVKAIVITGAGRLFCAGADIREQGGEPKEPLLPAVLNRIEQSNKPVVAAIFGVAAGGGLELALACHWRIAAVGTRVGLPEVTLGIVPGAGGTQRLPRLIGAERALDMITQGDLRPVERVSRIGLIDMVVPEKGLLDAAIEFARETSALQISARRTCDQGVVGDKQIIHTFLERMKPRWRGLDAPFAASELISLSLETPCEEGLKKEREVFLRLQTSDKAKALRHCFFAERQASKLPSNIPGADPLPVSRAGIVGAGTMGGGIAMNFLNIGIPVVIVDTSQEALDRGIEVIRKNYQRTVSRGRISSADLEHRMSLLTGSLSYSDLSEADIVIEAIVENMAVKKKVFAELDRVTKPATILATNTSTLDVNEIASATRRPEKVVGTHFFSPANVMKLMENVRGEKTSPQTVSTVMQLGKDLGKLPVLVGVCFGFVGNRMLYAYTRQANFLIEEGARPEQVDRVIRDFGLPMGPFQMADLTGIDVGYNNRKANQAIMAPEGMRGFTVADRLAELGRYGQKNGLGWYVYDEQRRRGELNPEVDRIIKEVVAEKGFTLRDFSDLEILERCLFPLVNEGAKILEEGVASRASDIDIIWTHGYGFPRYRGGPMFWADQIGLDGVLEGVKKLHKEVGEWCRPAPLLEELVRENKTFSEWSSK